MIRNTIYSVVLIAAAISALAQPTLNLPDEDIVRVYHANWDNTLAPCIVPVDAEGAERPSQHHEPKRPWKVDVSGHYPGWYPGVDVKHQAAAYLAYARDIDLVLRAWELTKTYQFQDGSVRSMTMYDNPHTVVPEATANNERVYYPLRLTGTIDFILLGDIIFRYTQDVAWLKENIEPMRKAAAYLEGWMDANGMLYCGSYDLDQVYRVIDGVGQAAAHHGFNQLAALESRLGNDKRADEYENTAQRLFNGTKRFFSSTNHDYYMEHLTYNNIASSKQGGLIVTASSELDDEHPATNATDDVIGIGIDAFAVGIGAAGTSEWASDGEEAAWVQIEFPEPVSIDSAILYNRTEPNLEGSDLFAEGRLTFSDGSDAIPVTFNDFDISRAVASFPSRRVKWIRFEGTKPRAEGEGNPGLAEFMVLPAYDHYVQHTHGVTDTNLAMGAFMKSDPPFAPGVWHDLERAKPEFHKFGDLHAPTWIADTSQTYPPEDLNKRAPYKDCVAIARIWRYDALLRHHMNDGDGLVKTIEYANALFDRPSGGGVGYFAERYGLGKYQEGDEAQATIPKYAGYPAIYNSTIVQECLLGMRVDATGKITIKPCVPDAWYKESFGQEGCGLLRDYDIGFTYNDYRVEGWIEGKPGTVTMDIGITPSLSRGFVETTVNDERVKANSTDGGLEFTVKIEEGVRSTFLLRSSD